MQWEIYANKFRKAAEAQNKSDAQISSWLSYARKLFDTNLPIIYDQTHFSQLLGINNEYLHRMSNAPQHFYRTFYIKKTNGKKRKIDEPLPDLKKVQTWIREEILYKIPCSKYAKAYIPKTSIRDNVRFHKNQEIVLTLDVKDFFPSIKSGRILNVFLSVGYNLPVAVLLTRLTCLNESLPQGAPTSAYLSNLTLKLFDERLKLYCLDRKIRFTRYADDLTFSGNFKIAQLLNYVDYELKSLEMVRNHKKFNVMRKGCRQIVTGVIVNEKQQLPKEYRMQIRQEIHYIQKFGLDSHLQHIGETRCNYVSHLQGKIGYALLINPKDLKMKEYLTFIQQL